MGVADGSALMRIDVRHVPMPAYLGVVGMPGITAWYGLNRIIAPRSGETVLVFYATQRSGAFEPTPTIIVALPTLLFLISLLFSYAALPFGLFSLTTLLNE